jgi:Helix-turn-helix domain
MIVSDLMIPVDVATVMNDGKDKTRRELSTQEASQIAGLSRNQITNLLRQGRIEGRNYGKRLWVVYADSLERYLATPHKSGPKGPRQKSSSESSNPPQTGSNGQGEEEEALKVHD